MVITERVRRVGLIVDHPSRDLPGMEVLALELAQRGVETALVPLYEQGVDVPLLGLDALVLNFARPVNQPLAQAYRELGLRLFVLDTEGGVLSETGRSSPAAIARYTRDSGFAALLDGYFFWGEALRDAFRAAGTMPEEQMHVTGCPRFDLYTPRWAGLEAPRRSGHVLVNTNFPAVNPKFSMDASGDAAALRSIGIGDDYIARLEADNRQIMQGMIGLVSQLARDLPEQMFVLRPHPFERQEAYRDAFAGLSNVVVDAQGPVLNALRGARALLHCNCSTAVEALMLRLPPLTPEWINTEFLRAHAPLPSRSSRAVATYSELCDLLASDDPERGFDMAEAYRTSAYPFFHHADGHAARRVAEVLVTACEGRQMGPRRARSLSMSLRGSYRNARLAQRLQGLAATLLGSARARDLRARLQPARTQKRFDPAGVAEALRVLAGRHAATMPRVRNARHPLSGQPLSTIIIAPAAEASSQ